MTAFTVSEPHPTVSAGTYIHSGRGGAGNYFRAPVTTPSSGVPMQVTSNTTQVAPRRYFSGRGGAGNAHPTAEAPAMNLDEEYVRAQHRDESGAGHVGRGGAGNFYQSDNNKSASSSRRASAESNESVRSGFWARISGSSINHH